MIGENIYATRDYNISIKPHNLKDDKIVYQVSATLIREQQKITFYSSSLNEPTELSSVCKSIDNHIKANHLANLPFTREETVSGNLADAIDQAKIALRKATILKFSGHENFICSISQEIMQDPVRSPCGHLFEKESLVMWLGMSRDSSCPECRTIIGTFDPARDIKMIIEDFQNCTDIPNFSKFEKDEPSLSQNLIEAARSKLQRNDISGGETLFSAAFCYTNNPEDYRYLVDCYKAAMEEEKYHLALLNYLSYLLVSEKPNQVEIERVLKELFQLEIITARSEAIDYYLQLEMYDKAFDFIDYLYSESEREDEVTKLLWKIFSLRISNGLPFPDLNRDVFNEAYLDDTRLRYLYTIAINELRCGRVVRGATHSYDRLCHRDDKVSRIFKITLRNTYPEIYSETRKHEAKRNKIIAQISSILDGLDVDNVPETVSNELKNSLNGLKHTIAFLLNMLSDKSADSKVIAAKALLCFEDYKEKALEALFQLTEDKSHSSAIALCELVPEDLEVTSKLLGLLEHADEGVRENVASALCEVRPFKTELLKLLNKLLEHNSDGVCRTAAKALVKINAQGPIVLTSLVEALKSDNSTRAGIVAEVFAEVPNVFDYVKELLVDSRRPVRDNAYKAIGEIGQEDSNIINELLLLFTHADSGIRESAIAAIHRVDSKNSQLIGGLIQHLNSSNPKISSSAAELLTIFSPENPEFIEQINNLLSSPTTHVIVNAAKLLDKIGNMDSELIPNSIRRLENMDFSVVNILGIITPDDHPSIRSIVDLLHSEKEQVRSAAASILKNIKPRNSEVIQRLAFDAFLTSLAVDTRREIIDILWNVENYKGFSCALEYIASNYNNNPTMALRAAEVFARGYPVKGLNHLKRIRRYVRGRTDCDENLVYQASDAIQHAECDLQKMKERTHRGW